MERFVVVRSLGEGRVRMYKIEAESWADAQVELEPDSTGQIFLEQDFNRAYESLKNKEPKRAGKKPHAVMRP